jgi:hypothetical protein
LSGKVKHFLAAGDCKNMMPLTRRSGFVKFFVWFYVPSLFLSGLMPEARRREALKTSIPGLALATKAEFTLGK